MARPRVPTSASSPDARRAVARANAKQVDAGEAARERVLAQTTVLLDAGGRLIARPVPRPRITFDLRGRSAGQFRVDGGEASIRYNAALVARDTPQFLAQTVPHEVAHYLAYLRFGGHIRPHGLQWQRLMRALGADPRRCHELDVTGLATRRLRRYPYYCQCGEHALTSIRHNRILRGASYSCRACGEALRSGRAPTPETES